MSTVPTCKICNRELKRVTASHLKTHGLTVTEYQSRYSAITITRKQQRCIYSNRENNWDCRNPAVAEGGGYCILHLPVPGKDLKSFAEKLQSTIRDHLGNPLIDAIHLEDTHFPLTYRFEFEKFEKRLLLNDAVFYESFEIRNCTLKEGAEFNGATFHKQMIFSRVEFEDVAEILGCDFRDEVRIYGTSFKGVTFGRSIFHNKTKIRHSIFEVFASFRHVGTPDEDSLLAFYFNRFPSGRETWFEDVDMEKISLLANDLRFARFTDVQWVHPPSPGTERKCLMDEFRNVEDERPMIEHLDRVRDAYQQLKMNFEESRNFSEAGDFYYGEMECRRKALGWKRFLPNLTTLYWLSTGYGERPLRAGLILTLVTTAWILLLMFGGLQPGQSGNGYGNIHYLPRLDLSQTSAFISDFLDTFSYVREILLREEKSDRIFSPLVQKGYLFDGHSINTIGFVIVYMQILLLALAIRRRFRR